MPQSPATSCRVGCARKGWRRARSTADGRSSAADLSPASPRSSDVAWASELHGGILDRAFEQIAAARQQLNPHEVGLAGVIVAALVEFHIPAPAQILQDGLHLVLADLKAEPAHQRAPDR